ncbi:MAG: UDP-3-O-acyl-N-acetylglucosamine deacetylase [Synergistota bacterium]|nr:UDP-3-O-acyl-N-acetylglucosamine deacetylase [Synergistota bacterium]
MEYKQLSRKLFWEGTGLHTGEHCAVCVEHNPPGGIAFRFGQKTFGISEAEISDTQRGTSLSFPDGGVVRTVEHLLGAVTGMGLWNVIVEVNGPEIPALDGSALGFATELRDSTLPVKTDNVTPINLHFPIIVEDKKTGAFAAAVPAETFSLSYIIRYHAPVIGCQAFESDITDDVFLREIAPARTFALASEVADLLRTGLARGGNIENALVLPDEGSGEQPEFRFPDEPVRHKALDLLGDLAVLGAPLKARVICYKGGHHLHQRFVERIRRVTAQQQVRKEKTHA